MVRGMDGEALIIIRTVIIILTVTTILIQIMDTDIHIILIPVVQIIPAQITEDVLQGILL